jgi:hypothetical protein
MADPLSIIGGIAAILQISGTVVNLIKSAKDASSDRQKLLAEINATTALCQTLNDYVHINGIEAWTSTLMTLQGDSTGPVEQFKSNLLFLEKKLAKRGFVLRWPFAKQEVKEVLESIERQKSFFGIALANDSVRLSKAIQDEVHTVAVETNAIRAQQQVELKRSILSCLSPIDFETTHADVRSRRAENTGRWLLETSEFKSWMTTPGILWCRGKAGTGKTILSSLIIDTLRHLQKSGSNLGVAGIYCSYRSPQTTKNMMGSILRQLLEPLEELPRSIMDNPSVAAQNPNAAFASISSSSYKRVMLVVDALDECTERIDLLRAIRQIPIEIHALIVSRTGIDDIERELRVARRLEIRSHEEDLRTFLQQNLRQQAYLSSWITDTPDFEMLVVDSVLTRSSEM